MSMRYCSVAMHEDTFETSPSVSMQSWFCTGMPAGREVGKDFVGDARESR